MGLKALALVALAACSGNKPKLVEDAAHTPPKSAPSDAAPAVAMTGTGDVQIRVEWKDTPQAMRAPGPATHCGSPRPAAVQPTTTWGVPDVLVSVDGAKAPEPRDVRMVVDDCHFAPRTALAGQTLSLASSMLEPVAVTLTPAGGQPRTIYLPIAGHAVDVALEPDTLYAITYGTDDTAAVATGGYVGATDASGIVVVRDLPAGPHTVRAQLPARAGADTRTATAQVTVTPGVLTEVTVDIGRP